MDNVENSASEEMTKDEMIELQRRAVVFYSLGCIVLFIAFFISTVIWFHYETAYKQLRQAAIARGYAELVIDNEKEQIVFKWKEPAAK